MAKMPKPDELRARFKELKAELEKKRIVVAKVEKERDALVAKYQPELRRLTAAVKKARADAGIHELEMELGQIARALGGKTG